MPVAPRVAATVAGRGDLWVYSIGVRRLQGTANTAMPLPALVHLDAPFNVDLDSLVGEAFDDRLVAREFINADPRPPATGTATFTCANILDAVSWAHTTQCYAEFTLGQSTSGSAW